MEETIKIRRMCKPGSSNQFGFKYSISSYKGAMARLSDKIKKGELEAELSVGLTYKEYISMLSNPDHGMKKVDSSNTCGTIVSIEDKYIELKLKDDKDIKKLFETYNKLGIKPVACMRYTGEKSIFARNKDMNLFDIITFDIDFPKVDIKKYDTTFSRLIKRLHEKYKGVCAVKDIYFEEEKKKDE